MAGNTNDEFVIDASFMLAYLLPDETSEIADEFFEKYAQGKVDCISTALLSFEVLNSLKVGITRKRIAERDALQLAEQFFRLHIQLKEVDTLKAFSVAIDENLTVYDASYVELARRQHVPLLTLDRKLEKLTI